MSYDRAHARALDQQRLAAELARVRAARRRLRPPRPWLEWAKWIVRAMPAVILAPLLAYGFGALWPWTRSACSTALAGALSPVSEVFLAAVDAPPVAHGARYDVASARAVFALDVTDEGPDDLLLPNIVKGPFHGTLVVWPRTLDAGPVLAYSPDQDFVGTDAFVYDVTDGRARSERATVMLHVAASRTAETERVDQEEP